jgi:ABC-2 type transport system permease protein
MFAKLAHGLLFAAFGSFLGAGLLAILLGLSAADAMGAIAVALALSALINMAGLWLDTANPRLDWNSPVAAMKQNPNSVIQILGAMLLIGGAGYLSFTMDWSKPLFLLLVGLPAFLLFLGLAWLYRPYAEKRLGRLEA